MNLSPEQRAAILNPAAFAVYDNPNRIYAAHWRLLARELLNVANGENTRLMVSMPPQHGKSEMCSKYFPAWYLGNFPKKKIILTSYEAGFASKWGGEARDALNAHAELFGPAIKGGKDAAAGAWYTNSGGYMVTAGAGGPITGYGADVFIIDDPIKNAEEALSSTIQTKLWDWYQSTVKTRLQPNGAIVLLMTRWHENDLAGQILRKEPNRWRVINLPAICDVLPDALGRKLGEPLFPARYSAAELAERKATTAAYWWEAMYQGRPSPREGGLFKREWWRYYRELPKVMRHIWSWDTAIKTGQQNDYTVGQCWAECENGYYLIRQIRARMEYPELKRAIVDAYHSRKLTTAAIIEDKSSGQQAVQELKRITKIPIIAVEADKDKVTRANRVTPIIESGRVFLPEGEQWISELVEECSGFPAAAHDDQVDALVHALTYLSTHNNKPNLDRVSCLRQLDALDI